ncbi:MAG: hypothetical protein PF689_01340 [Deltaproteobacteria bacterium]|jgi:hypothetical protein|nr:hypothetical protein [Deltaproteobacteria bacterium]
MAVLDYIIPGYKGYRERTQSRATDRAFRDYLTAKMKEVHDRLEQVKYNITSDLTKISLMNDAENATMLLTKVRDRLRWSNQGFAGNLFGSKTETEAIDAIAEFDKKLEEHREKVFNAIEEIETKFAEGENIKPLFMKLTNSLRALDTHLNDRENLLRKTIG